ncbi:MAG: uncharacterized protein K0R12_184 [Gammaproteobacteria bacterium]|jgi:predicted metal-dependent hydrolase|nr:uncharacterized protein [Gammaproteobacteria bacterium]
MLKVPLLPPALAWLPHYHLRVSTRARYSQLRIHPDYGLEVILPKKASQKVIPRLLEEHVEWINRHREVILKAYERSATPAERPTRLGLTALSVEYPIHYQTPSSLKSRPKAALLGDTLWIYADPDNERSYTKALLNFLHYQAKIHLEPWLKRLSEEHALPYRSLQIRSQHRRWGSCSHRGDISLNDKLLFLPPNLVNHVLIHELCHTRHLNHSKHFWALVKRLDPAYHASRCALSRAEAFLPDWCRTKRSFYLE